MCIRTVAVVDYDVPQAQPVADPVDRCNILACSAPPLSSCDSLLARVVLQINMNRCIVAVIGYRCEARRGRERSDAAPALVKLCGMSACNGGLTARVISARGGSTGDRGGAKACDNEERRRSGLISLITLGAIGQQLEEGQAE